jgi:hypothetical protein
MGRRGNFRFVLVIVVVLGLPVVHKSTRTTTSTTREDARIT